MTSTELARHLFQDVYYDNIDRGEMDAAVQALHPDCDWSHAQVWAHHEFSQGQPGKLTGRDAVLEFLNARIDQLRAAGITHHVRDIVTEDGRGAFLGAVEGPGPEKGFMVWFELKDDLISRYTLRPL